MGIMGRSFEIDWSSIVAMIMMGYVVATILIVVRVVVFKIVAIVAIVCDGCVRRSCWEWCDCCDCRQCTIYHCVVLCADVFVFVCVTCCYCGCCDCFEYGDQWGHCDYGCCHCCDNLD